MFGLMLVSTHLDAVRRAEKEPARVRVILGKRGRWRIEAFGVFSGVVLVSSVNDGYASAENAELAARTMLNVQGDIERVESKGLRDEG